MGLSMQIATLVNLKSGPASGVCFFLEQDNVKGGVGGGLAVCYSQETVLPLFLYIYINMQRTVLETQLEK